MLRYPHRNVLLLGRDTHRLERAVRTVLFDFVMRSRVAFIIQVIVGRPDMGPARGVRTMNRAVHACRRVFPAAYGALCWGLLLVAGCGGGAPRDEYAGLTTERVQTWAFLPRDVVRDMRRSDSDEQEDIARWPQFRRIALVSGWSEPESSGTWTAGPQSTLRLNLDHEGNWSLYFSGKPADDLDSNTDPILRFVINDVESGRVELERRWADYVVPLAPGTLRRGRNEIVLSGNPAASDRVGATAVELRDSRPVQFRAIGVIESDAWTSDGPSTEFDEERGRLRVMRSGKLFVPIRAAEAASSVTLGVSAWSLPWTSPVEFRATLQPVGRADVDPVVLAEESLGGPLGSAEFSTATALHGKELTLGCLVFEMHLSDSWDRAALDVLEWTSAGSDSTARESGLEPSPRVDTLPDIVVIVLDAARADHFGVYGYGRNTTPQIDDLAAGSVVFRNAFAPTPYTRSSVPTLITGLSFHEHEVISQNHVLNEDARTLAEYLQGIGYRTACYTANANHSVASGTDQGCDEFHELWRNPDGPGPHEEWNDPHRLSELAREQLVRDSDQPLFLMLHYVPPHVPYAPREEFDVFTDESYTGPYTGLLATMRAINQGELRPSVADLNHVMSLYDGNLRMGDDAVGKVLDVLRRRDRWDQTMVLVLSDHGEAFEEHGRMGHNTTVYDEMLHIPFILRLPGDVIPERVDTEALVTLADVVPTVLGYVGLEPDGPLTGADLLSPATFDVRRSLAARSSGERPAYAYRTLDWKAIATGAELRRQEVYNLRADPAETKNLASEQLDTSLCLATLLRQELSESRKALSAGEVPALSRDDMEALRSLGYVR